MSKTISDQLCHGIRACGLPKHLSHQLLNTYIKWLENNGEDWTNERIKAYKQWYISFLAGTPTPPEYTRKSKQNLPTGVFGELFKVKNQAKVLAALSANTVFVADELTARQKDKFLDGLNGDAVSGREVSEDDCEIVRKHVLKGKTRQTLKYHRFSHATIPPITPVVPEDMTAMSIPISDGKILRVREDDNRSYDVRRALLESWRCVPYPVLDYLDREDRLDMIPENLLGTPPYPPIRKNKRDFIGRIGLIQEPGLKLRSVANPNRVAQALTKPLASFWEEGMKTFVSDCTFDQEKGVRWVQGKLAKGSKLASSDLSSATDLLDLDCCLQLADAVMIPLMKANDKSQVERYENAKAYFRDLSRGYWYTPKSSKLGPVSWKQGQPLGLYPSFRLLSLTNNSMGVIAAKKAGLDPYDSFRVIGDDIIMDARMEEAYIHLVEGLGGKVNRSKTVCSDRVAEFAGRIITPNRVMRKTYRYTDPSDTSFMSYVADLGPQAVGILRPRQRRQWENFKFIPGVAYDGPWNPDSLGEPLVARVAWAESTHLFDEAPDPDKQLASEEQLMFRLVQEAAEREKTKPKEIEKDLPWMVEDDIQSSYVLTIPDGKSGDPRLKEGLTTLRRLEAESGSATFVPYKRFKAEKMLKPKDSEGEIPMVPVQDALGQVDPVGPDQCLDEHLADAQSQSGSGEPGTGTCKGPHPAVEPSERGRSAGRLDDLVGSCTPEDRSFSFGE